MKLKAYRRGKTLQAWPTQAPLLEREISVNAPSLILLRIYAGPRYSHVKEYALPLEFQ